MGDKLQQTRGVTEREKAQHQCREGIQVFSGARGISSQTHNTQTGSVTSSNKMRLSYGKRHTQVGDED